MDKDSVARRRRARMKLSVLAAGRPPPARNQHAHTPRSIPIRTREDVPVHVRPNRERRTAGSSTGDTARCALGAFLLQQLPRRSIDLLVPPSRPAPGIKSGGDLSVDRMDRAKWRGASRFASDQGRKEEASLTDETLLPYRRRISARARTLFVVLAPPQSSAGRNTP